MRNNRGIINELQKNIRTPISKIRVYDTKNVDNFVKTRNSINSLQNPSFEDWDTTLSNWTWREVESGFSTTPEYVKDTTEKVFGNNSAKLYIDYPTWSECDFTWDEATFTWDEFGEGQGELYQNLSFGGDTAYYGGYCKGQGYFGLVCYDESDNILSSRISAFDLADWRLFKLSMAIPEDTLYIRVVIGVAVGSDGAWFDGMFVSENRNYRFADVKYATYDEFIPVNCSIRRDAEGNSTSDIYIPIENRTTFQDFSFGIIDKYNIVEVFCGYHNREKNIDFYERVFTGVIVKGDIDDDKIIKVSANDFSEYFKGSISKLYPDRQSYLDMPDDEGFDFVKAELKKENYPQGMYDNWILENVIRDLCIKVNFPLYFTKIFNSKIRLSIGVDTYPYQTEDSEGSPAYSFGYGTKIWDIIKEIAEEYGYIAYFNNDGIFEFKPVGFWEIHYPDEMIYDNNFVYTSNPDEFTAENPTWTYISNELNPDSGEILIDNIQGQNLRLYTESKISDGTMSVTIFYTDTDETVNEVSLGEFSLKGTMDDGTRIFDNYIDIFANSAEYIGGKAVFTINSGTVGISGYGFNNDNLSSPQMIFTSVKDITSSNVQMTSENIRNSVIVVGQNRQGKDIAVQAIDEWSIYGGRYLTNDDITVSSDKLITNESALFDQSNAENAIIPENTTMSIVFSSNQYVTKVINNFDMSFGDRIRYEVQSLDGSTTFFSSGNENNADSQNFLSSDGSFFANFYLGFIGNKKFIADTQKIRIYDNGEFTEVFMPNNRRIIDVSESGDYIFVLTEEFVYRYSFTADETIEYSDNSSLSDSQKHYLHTILATSDGEAFILSGYYGSTISLFKTDFGGSLIAYSNAFTSVTSNDFLNYNNSPKNRKAIAYINNYLYFTFNHFEGVNPPIEYTTTYNNKLDNQSITVVELDKSLSSNTGTVYNSPQFINNNSSLWCGVIGSKLMILVSGESGILGSNYFFVCDDPMNTSSWDLVDLDTEDQIFIQYLYYTYDSTFYLFGIQNKKITQPRFAPPLIRDDVSEEDLTVPLVITSDNKSSILKEVLSDYSILPYTEDDGLIFYNSGEEYKISIGNNGLYFENYSDFSQNINHSLFEIDINEELSGLKFIFYEATSDIKISDIEIYSRNIRNNRDLLPVNEYTYENRTRPLSGSWDSLVGNTSEKTLPYYNYQQADLPPNYIGTKRELIYKDGRLNNKAICVWLAQNLLYRNRKQFFEYNASVAGNPLMEFYDCVQFIDSEKGFGTDNYFWIEGFNLSWGSNPSLDLQVTGLKPVNSYQNFLDIYERLPYLLNVPKVAFTNKDTPSDRDFVTGTFSSTGVNERTFTYDTPTDAKLDPFYESIGVGFAISKNCNITMEVWDEDNEVKKKIILGDFKAGDIFSSISDLILFDGRGNRTVDDAGDYLLYLEEGDYRLVLKANSAYNKYNNAERIIIPFTVEYQYEFRTWISDVYLDSTAKNVVIETSSERKLISGGAWETLSSDRTFTIFKPYIFEREEFTTKRPTTLASYDEVDWGNNDSRMFIPKINITVRDGYEPVVLLGAVRDLSGRDAIKKDETLGFRQVLVSELFDNLTDFYSRERYDKGSEARDRIFNTGHYDVWRLRKRSNREVKPYNFTSGRIDPSSLNIYSSGGSTGGGILIWNGSTGGGNASNSAYFSFNGSYLFWNYSNFERRREGNYGYGSWYPYYWNGYNSLFNTEIERIKDYVVEWRELVGWHEITGWS